MSCHRFLIKKEGFHPITSITANMPMDQIAMDLFDMPTSEEGHIKGLVVVDVCTRFVWIRALRTAMAKDVARQLYKLFCTVGFPKIIQSDNGPEFRANLIHQLAKLVEAEHRFSTPYHPQGNGMAEAFVKKAKLAILKSLDGVTLHWKKCLPAIQCYLNSKVLSVHRSTPFSLFYARTANPLSKWNKLEGVQNPLSHDELLERLKYMERIVFPAIAESSTAIRSPLEQKYNLTKALVSIPDGAFVMIKDDRLGPKADPQLKGPFMVVQRTRGGSYVLQDGSKVVLPRHYSPSQLVMVKLPDGLPDSYEVEQIVAHRKAPGRKQGFEFKVRWKGYSSRQDTWEPAASFDDPSFVRKYLETQKLLGNPNLVKS